jgi:hypothetical protein
MSIQRNEMIMALKEIIVPVLRKMGFSGSFPHFRRQGEKAIDLLTFQFDRNGGGFIIEISQCSPEGFTTYWDELIPPNKVTAHDLNKRLRLQLKQGSSTDDWFRFDKGTSSGEKSIYMKVAESVVPHLKKAEIWWKDNRRTMAHKGETIWQPPNGI